MRYKSVTLDMLTANHPEIDGLTPEQVSRAVITLPSITPEAQEKVQQRVAMFLENRRSSIDEARKAVYEALEEVKRAVKLPVKQRNEILNMFHICVHVYYHVQMSNPPRYVTSLEPVMKCSLEKVEYFMSLLRDALK